jgi:cyclic pyranopterin phosphate synthase
LSNEFSHVDGSGKIRMVDVSDKPSTRRSASAACVILTTADLSGDNPEFEGLEMVHSARLAGILAAKQTAQLIPLCHPLNLDDIQVDVLANAHGVEIRSSVATVHQTGVEMEALTACAVAALSLLTSLLAVDRRARMDDLVLLRKSGGRSGDWGRETQT